MTEVIAELCSRKLSFGNQPTISYKILITTSSLMRFCHWNILQIIWNIMSLTHYFNVNCKWHAILIYFHLDQLKHISVKFTYKLIPPNYVCNVICISAGLICYHDFVLLTHWGRVTHKCVDKLTIIGSHNIPNCMKEVTWLSYGLCTNGHRSAALGWLPFILPPVFVHAAVIRSL